MLINRQERKAAHILLKLFQRNETGASVHADAHTTFAQMLAINDIIINHFKGGRAHPANQVAHVA